MYSLGAYGSMIADRVRVDAYARALRQHVREGSVVAEIGTGPGIFAVLACQLGAARVYAIESTAVIQVAREVAAANGCTDKIEFYEALSERVTLPTRADVIVSDLRGVLPALGRHLPAIVDARRRFLSPGGALIPRRDTLWAAIVETPENYGQIVNPWECNSLDQDLSPARRLIVNDLQKVRITPEQLLTSQQLWTTLEYYSLEEHDVRGTLHWQVRRPGTGHGILVWFDADLAEGIGFSNAPGAPETIYGSLFFPWTYPVALASGQEVTVSLEADLVEDDYIWRWNTSVEASQGSSDARINFEQSTLTGPVLSVAQLLKGAADHIPRLSEEGCLRHRALELMDGRTSLDEIARRLLTDFPEHFRRWEQALAYAGALSQEYGR